MRRYITILFCLLLVGRSARADVLLISMGASQTNHLKAYGVVYAAISAGHSASWLLNHEGGSFAIDYKEVYLSACRQRQVLCKRISNADYNAIAEKLRKQGSNTDIVPLTKVPRIAVYTPDGKKPWDDAVTLALTYAGIPFDKIYANEVLRGSLSKYDWLHLHHEDFTGQHGKFWAQYKDAPWYKEDTRAALQLANSNGYKKVWQMQWAIVKKIRDFVAAGGNLFAMCSATDTYDIMLAANGVDICDVPFDGDKPDPDAQQKLKFANCFAFTDFQLSTNPYEYEYATIDNTSLRPKDESKDFFNLKFFSARFDPVPAMLCQNHTRRIKGFSGQTTAFRKEAIKNTAIILADRKDLHEVRYLHGSYKAGTWTFYGGHDPEDYEHRVGEPPTNLDDHPNSPGYRLILNNVLCLASGKKEVPVVKLDVTESTTTTEQGTVRLNAGPTGNTLSLSITGGAGIISKVAFEDRNGKNYPAPITPGRLVTVSIDNLPQGIYTVIVNGIIVGKVASN